MPDDSWIDDSASRMLEVAPAEDMWGPAQALVASGQTREPQRPLAASIGGMKRFLNAYSNAPNTYPINTADIIHMPIGELGPQAVQGARDLINMFIGKPKQEFGRLVPAPDPYNPLLPNGGT